MKSKFLKLLSLFLIAIMMANVGGVVSYASDYDEDYEEEELAGDVIVTFNLNNSYADPEEDNERIGFYLEEEYGDDIPEPEIEGFEFLGWFTSKTGGEEVTSETECINPNNHTLYARWEAYKYNIKFDKNKATSGKVSPIKNRKYGQKYKFPKSNLKRTGYIFAGWNTKKNGKGDYYPANSTYQDLTTEENGTVTLYAQWAQAEYKIKYNLQKGKNSVKNPTKYKFGKVTKLYNPTRKGYKFQGWYTKKSGGEKVKSIKKSTIGNITLYARWKK